MKVALLGTGTMGAGMARTMQREGHEVTAWNRTVEKARPLADDGVRVAESVADAVSGADVVITMLFDTDAVLAVTDDITAAMADHAVWLQSSTVGPDGMQRIVEAAPGARIVDAPMLGTKEPAEQGKLVPLVAGDPALIDAAQPVLDAVGARTVRAGDELGRASALKLACNAWILTITAATAQSVALAEKQGLDAATFLEAIKGGPADTPYAQLKGSMMIEGSYPASFGLDGGRKDLALIRAAAKGAGVDTAVLDGVIALFDRASQDGHGEDDLAAVRTALG